MVESIVVSSTNGEPLHYVILKPQENVPPNAAVLICEGGENPRKLAVKPPNGQHLQYTLIKQGDDIPENSVVFSKRISKEEKGKACVAVTSYKPLQYIVRR